MSPPNSQPASQLIETPGAFLTGPELLAINALVQMGIRYVQTHDAITPPPHLVAAVRLVKRAADRYRAMSDVGPEPRTLTPTEASSTQDIDGPDEITAREAADILGYSDTHVRRIRQHLGLMRTNPYMFDRRTVLAYAARRKAEQRERAA